MANFTRFSVFKKRRRWDSPPLRSGTRARFQSDCASLVFLDACGLTLGSSSITICVTKQPLSGLHCYADGGAHDVRWTSALRRPERSGDRTHTRGFEESPFYTTQTVGFECTFSRYRMPFWPVKSRVFCVNFLSISCPSVPQN